MSRLTKAQEGLKKSLIQRVHVAPKYKSYYKDNREDYEEKLFEHFGKRSSKDLSIDQLFVLVAWLNNESPVLETIKDRSKDVTKKQLIMIKGLWEVYANDQSETALRAFVLRITKNRYLNMESISKADATKCIVALKKTLKEK